MRSFLFVRLLAAFFCCFAVFSFSPLNAQTTAFTYQGRLNRDNMLLSGTYDLIFTLFSTNIAGLPVAGPITNSSVSVTNGLFTTLVDFGNAYEGQNNWLEIAVCTNLANTFSTLAPRQQITPVPSAIFASNASNLLGNLPVGNLNGTISLSQLPANIVTNGAVGVNINGTFNGDGAGLTNVNLLNLNNQGAIAFQTNSGNFVLASTLSAGQHPTSVVVADINGDAKPDLICVNSFSTYLSVYTNIGNGNFALDSKLNLGLPPYFIDEPSSVAVADVNGDGRPDLICLVHSMSSDTVEIFLNTGNGKFTFSSSVPDRAHPAAIVSADVNGDGKPDFITAGYYDSSLHIFTNNGTGGFSLASAPMVGAEPVSIVVSDINGDGKPDLISANSGANTLTVLTNDGRGFFVLSSSPSVGSQPVCVVAADVNGDGKPDLIAANLSASTLTVLTNDGSGRFGLSSTIASGFDPYSVLAADVNQDGKVDLIPICPGWLNIFTNNGNGIFAQASSQSISDGSESGALADVNGDGKPDLIITDFDNADLSVYFNTTSYLGVFSGNGSGLAGLNASNLNGVIPQTNLGTNGFYTVTIGNGTNDFVTTTQSGYYAQIGNLVYFEAWAVWSGKGSATNGNLQVSLPPIPVISSRAVFNIGLTSGIKHSGGLIAISGMGESSINIDSISPFNDQDAGVPLLNCSNKGEMQITGIYRWR